MRILIAEDSQTDRHLLKKILIERGHDVITACDGIQAWQILSQENVPMEGNTPTEGNAPRLVILDWIMPGMNGVEVCRKFRETRSSRPTYIILLTGKKTSTENLIEGLEAGADDYLIKPVDPDELHARVQSGMRVLELQSSLVDRAKELEQAEQSLQRRNTELTTLNTVAQALSTTLQLDKLLEHVLDGLQQMIPFDAALISLLHTANIPDNGKRRNGPHSECGRSPIAWPVAFRGIEHSSSQGVALKELPLVQRIVRERGPVIVPDVHNELELLSRDNGSVIPSTPHRGRNGLVRSWLGVPLISKDRVIGVILIGSHHPKTYDKDTARLAFAFAHQVALAIDNSRLYEQTRAHLRETLLLHSVTAALSSTLDVDQMLPYMAHSLCEALNSTSVEIYEPNLERNTITIIADYKSSDVSTKEHHSNLGQTCSLVDFPVAADVLTKSRPRQIRVNDPEVDPRDRANMQVRDAQAMLLLPMVAHGNTMGLAVAWESQAPRRFTQGETATGQTLTHQAAIAMDHARLFAETRRRVSELELLHDMGLATASGARLEDALQAAADALATALQDTQVAIMLLDSKSNTLRIRASVGYPSDVIDNLCLELGDGLSGWVAQHGQPVIVPDVRLDPRYYQAIPDTRSELCVPLATGPSIIGVLNVASPQVDAFTNDDLRLLSTLASNLAVLVERVRLFTQVEEARIELQQRAEALEEANVRLQELDRLKDQFFANMSHELRTPLGSIIGFSEVLLKGIVGEMSPQQTECVQDILASGDHLMALINDVLDLSKIEAGHMTLEPTTFEVAELLAEVQATISPLIEKKSQALLIEQDNDLPLLTADRFRIKQVLLNLLSNANKFTPIAGSITISCHQSDPTTTLFSVADTGVGIKAEDHKIIFEKFRQAGDSSKRVTGTGLGLNISRQLVEMHGGRIWIESECGHGATFSFSLPVV